MTGAFDNVQSTVVGGAGKQMIHIKHFAKSKVMFGLSKIAADGDT